MTTSDGHGIPRRTVVAGGLIGLAGLGLAQRPAAALVKDRATLPSGIQIGDVTTDSAVVWSRSDRDGRLRVEVLDKGGRVVVPGGIASADSDFTASVRLKDLQPGREYRLRVGFEDGGGTMSETAQGSFRTASAGCAPVSVAFTGDTAGQGWGINPDLGGMFTYRAILERNPDLLIHSGDNIYADGPILAEVKEKDGNIWRNVVTPEVSKVAETLTEFRGRYRYNQLDTNIRELYARVPVVAQWDDHEVHNNWYPGQVLTDDRYTERRVGVLSARGAKAWFENMPVDTSKLVSHDGVYRTIHRGELLDIFVLDMRTFRADNPSAAKPAPSPMLGERQMRWLLRELTRSRATWKVIAADMPLGIKVTDTGGMEAVSDGVDGAPGGREHEFARLLRELKRRRIQNVVWLTADVHYAAAHRYEPDASAIGGFDPFYEFVAGAIHAGSFGPNEMDSTFGPQVLFAKSGDYPSQSPRFGKNQFFGDLQISASGDLRVDLVDGTGAVVHTTELDPVR